MNSAVVFFPEIYNASRPHRDVDMSVCRSDTIISETDEKFDDDDNRFSVSVR